MNRSRSTTKVMAALIAGGGLRVFFFPDTGGLVSMALMFGLGTIILGLLYVPWLTGIKWLRTMRDVGIVFGVNILIVMVVGTVSILITGSDDAPMNAIAVANIASTLAGFLLVGLLTWQDRAAHLARVAVAVWLLSGVQLLLAPANCRTWMLGFFLTFASMWVGCGIAWLLRKPYTDQVTPEQNGKHCQQSPPCGVPTGAVRED